MKDIFPNYRQITAELLLVEMHLTPIEKKLIDDFIKVCSLTTKGEKLKKIKRHILQLKDITGVELDKQTKDSVIHFITILNNATKSEHTKNETKCYVKKFLRLNYKTNTEIIETLDLIKRKSVTTTLTESDLLTDEEVEAMLRHAETYKEKAYVYTIYESGLRPEEILNLQWKDIIFEGDICTIKVYSNKTGQYRETYITKSKKYLWEWKENYSFPDIKPTDYVFPSYELKFLGNKRVFTPIRDKRMTTNGGIKLLRRLGDKAGIKKRIWNYLNRHSRATKLYETLPTPIVEKLLGHKNQYHVYAHISNKKARSELMEKVLGLKEMPKSERESMENEIQKQKIEIELLKNKETEVQETINKFKETFKEMEYCNNELISEMKKQKEHFEYIFKRYPEFANLRYKVVRH